MKTILKTVLDAGAIMPVRAYEDDAGLDLFTPANFTVPSHGTAAIDIGVHIEIPQGYVGLIKSKSGLYHKHDITVDGTVDAGYTGSIKVKLCNVGSFPYSFKSGDKIAQLVILPIITPSLEVVNSLERTARGDGGFGSTGNNVADIKD